MIVHHVGRWVYLAAPKTASISLHAWLPGERSEFAHSMHVQAPAESYLRWTVLRDPYDRAVSLWTHYWNHEQGMQLDFRQFCFALADRLLPPFYQWNQSDWLRGQRLDAVVRFEHLAIDLRRLPIALPADDPPHLGDRLHDSPSVRYDAETRGLIRDWAAADIDLVIAQRDVVWSKPWIIS